MKVVHIITGLLAGGAETMLYKLLASATGETERIHVVSLTDEGVMGKSIANLGIKVTALGMRPGKLDLGRFAALVRILKQDQPDLVQTWMYHADLLGGLAAKLSGNMPIVWNVRHANLDAGINRYHTIWTAKICALISKWVPTRIICNSRRSFDLHTGIGYARHKMLLIPNGFDTALFRFDATARASMRQELGVSEREILIGLIGRFDPQKDHENFIAAAKSVAGRLPNARFLLCGHEITWENQVLANWIEAAGLRSRFHLLGLRRDIPRVFCALDVACSASVGESFSNAIGEAMACGIPCVVTDVGDSAFLLGGFGKVVPPRNSEALADGILCVIQMDRDTQSEMVRMARERVLENYDIHRIHDRYSKLYREIIEGKICAE